MRIPNTSLIAFNDMIFNFPTLCCNSLHIAEVVITAIKELCQAWAKKQDNRLISFGLMINLTEEAGHISFVGHVNDFIDLLDLIPKVSDVPFEEWIEAIYQENNRFKLGEDCPNKFRLIHGDVVCFERLIVHPDIIRKMWMEDGCVHAQFNISKEDGDELIKHKIISAPFYRIIQDKCNKCGKDYLQCTCVKFIDEDVSDEVVKADLLGLIWTNRNAFFPDGQLEFM